MKRVFLPVGPVHSVKPHPCHVRQPRDSLPQNGGVDGRVVLRARLAVVADDLHRHCVAGAADLQERGSAVPQRVK